MKENLRSQSLLRGRQHPTQGHGRFFWQRPDVLLAVVGILLVGALASSSTTCGCDGEEGDQLAAVSPSPAVSSAVALSSSTTGSTAGATTASAGSSVESSTTTTAAAVPLGTSTAAQAGQIGANELGCVPVLMCHLIGTGKSCLTPDQLRFHIALLRSHGFYPTTVREMVEDTMEIPAGKSPVVLTFDDSSPGQYRIGVHGLAPVRGVPEGPLAPLIRRIRSAEVQVSGGGHGLGRERFVAFLE